MPYHISTFFSNNMGIKCLLAAFFAMLAELFKVTRLECDLIFENDFNDAVIC